jgi:hypothetical protein
MDVFEKQQTIEAIKTVVKGRWFFVSTLFLQGIISLIFFPEVPIPTGPIMSAIVFSAFAFNFGFWLYVRRPEEKIGSGGIQIVKAMQVFLDQVWISAVLFFTGTIGTLPLVLYFIVIMVGVSLYKRKGIILSTISGCFLFSIIAYTQYKGILAGPHPAKEVLNVAFTPGDKHWLIMILIAFYIFYASSAILASYLAGLFKKREARLIIQKQELTEKTRLLTVQTRELTQTKDYLHEALTKSDKARGELEHTKAELEKSNLELKAKLVEVEKYGEITTGRELKMMELKNEIKDLRDTIANLKGRINPIN